VEHINAYPALLGSILPIIVVGSHDVSARKSSFSQTGNALSVYALGEGVICANGGHPLLAAMPIGTSMGKLRDNQIFYLQIF
jgi:hypothetical protein